MQPDETGAEEQFEVLLAGADDARQRLDTFIAAHAPEWVSRSRIKTLVKAGHMSVNGKVCDEPNYRLKENDQITWQVPEPEDAEPVGEDIALDVVFEDEHLIVINKPSGMVVHPAAGNWTGTLVNALIYHCGDSLSGVGGVKRPGIVHRLDKDTSGLLVVAKNDRAHQALSAQFADHGRNGALKRSYLALCWNLPDQPKGTVSTFLGRDSGNRLKRAVVKEGAPDAKWAVTHFVREDLVLAKTQNDGPLLELGMVRCQLETGRTHQIRVHMAHIGCPLLGDVVYGAGFASRANKLTAAGQKAVRKFGRQALHAQSLGFAHPVSEELMVFESELADDFTQLIAAL